MKFTHIAGSAFVNVTPPPQGPPLRNDAWERIAERMVADIDAGIEPFGLRFRDDGTAKPTEHFWRAWKLNKLAIKDTGYYVRKVGGDYLVTKEHPRFWVERVNRSINRSVNTKYPRDDDSTKQRVMERYRRRKAEREANPDAQWKAVQHG